MADGDRAIDEDVAAHDRAVAAAGLPIWIGGEPTFTDRSSFDAPWTSAALGGDKEARARAMVRAIAERTPGALLLRTTGRRYPGEEAPRFSYGVYARRDGAALRPAGAPDDPLTSGVPDAPAEGSAARLRDAIAARGGEVVDVRVARLDEGIDAIAVELPEVATVPAFVALAAAVLDAAAAVGAPAIVLVGAAPPVDASVAFTTVTPDPAVVEVNAAPCRDLAEYLAGMRLVHACAESVGLSPVRLAYDGDVLDSGGGGHVTLGGPSPAESPFARAIHLLPGLVRYANRHPSLSYLFAVDSLGASSQSPRADEGLAESFGEIALALARLARQPAADVDALWSALAPLLADHAGNAHRAEINVEKLASPHLPGRGRLGLVELRALRMAEDPARAAAVAALLRAVAARLAVAPYAEPLVRWGEALHDRFALPFFLRADLAEVLADLDAHGLGLGPALAARLFEDEGRETRTFAIAPGVTATITRALEFWPLLGDSASQERSTARWVDASTRRIEIAVRAEGPARLDGVVATARGVRVPLVRARDARGEALVAGVRYRAFAPSPGLHPGLPAEGPLALALGVRGEPAVRATLHPWIPGGGAYDGLPRDRAEARRRREERLVVEAAADALDRVEEPPVEALSGHAIDLRFV